MERSRNILLKDWKKILLPIVFFLSLLVVFYSLGFIPLYQFLAWGSWSINLLFAEAFVLGTISFVGLHGISVKKHQ
ncbi:MAG: hypothetical protein R3350_05975 [Saprospiraceae bacterium]|nr:hypothetical protein [Saprospiraceae bacterium]